MVLFAFAVPGRFGEWCNALIARLAELQLGAVAPIRATGPDDAATDLINFEGANFLVQGPQPGPWLHRLLKSTGKPFTIALTDPRDATLDLIYRHGVATVDAVRRVATSCASLMSCTALPQALVLHSGRNWQQPVETAESIARHFGLAPSRDEIEAIIEELAVSGLGQETDPPEWAADSQAQEAVRIVSGAVAPYVDHFLGAPFLPITWARDLVMADGNVPATQPVDITGRARPLFYGPYINVPPGNWTAEVVLTFSQEATDANFLVDVLAAGTQICSTTIEPMRRGVHSVQLNFVIDADNTHPLEIRVMNEKPAFDGWVSLGRITLTLQQNEVSAGDALPEALDLPAAALDQ